MKPDIFPRAVSQVFLGLSQLGVPSLIPEEYQKYVDYLDPSDHEFSFSRGSIDIQSAPDLLILILEALDWATSSHLKVIYHLPQPKGN